MSKRGGPCGVGFFTGLDAVRSWDLRGCSIVASPPAPDAVIEIVVALGVEVEAIPESGPVDSLFLFALQLLLRVSEFPLELFSATVAFVSAFDEVTHFVVVVLGLHFQGANVGQVVFVFHRSAGAEKGFLPEQSGLCIAFG